eukprot:363309-Chlamydomonas_euryale.AAC.21
MHLPLPSLLGKTPGPCCSVRGPCSLGRPSWARHLGLAAPCEAHAAWDRPAGQGNQTLPFHARPMQSLSCVCNARTLTLHAKAQHAVHRCSAKIASGWALELPHQPPWACTCMSVGTHVPNLACRPTAATITRWLLQAFGFGNFPGVDGEAIVKLEERYAAAVKREVTEKLAEALQRKDEAAQLPLSGRSMSKPSRTTPEHCSGVGKRCQHLTVGTSQLPCAARWPMHAGMQTHMHGV